MIAFSPKSDYNKKDIASQKNKTAAPPFCSNDQGKDDFNHEASKQNWLSSRLGFVMAAAGSAVGLGNIWRFPYLVAKYGGGIFLLVYLVLAVTFGFALMTTEIAIGRKTGKSAILAYKAVNQKFRSWVTLPQQFRF